MRTSPWPRSVWPSARSADSRATLIGIGGELKTTNVGTITSSLGRWYMREVALELPMLVVLDVID